jgi:hypothetical protein
MSPCLNVSTIYIYTSVLSIALPFIIISVYAYVRFIKLQVRPECISLHSEGTDCAPPLPRPPPKPDPPSKQSASKALLLQHKALLAELCYQQQLRRLHRRQRGMEIRQHSLDVSDCKLWCQLVYLPLAILGLCWVSMSVAFCVSCGGQLRHLRLGSFSMPSLARRARHPSMKLLCVGPYFQNSV